MAKSDSLHISIIPTISAGWNKTYSGQCCLPVQPFLYSYCGCVYRPLLEPVESLLQMLLLWDPAARGGTVDADTNKPYCNTALQNILNLKVNMIFFLKSPLESLLQLIWDYRINQKYDIIIIILLLYTMLLINAILPKPRCYCSLNFSKT